MAGSLWYKPRTPAQSIYYTVRCVAGKSFRMRPEIEDTFQGEFVYALPMLRETIPFACLLPSSTALHVGFDRTYLSITVNGAETEVFEGAKKTLSNNPRLRISMALAFTHFSFEIRKKICNRMMSEGWNVVVSNSPHDPWSPKVFLWCCMVRESEELMEYLGAEQVTWEQAAERASHESALVEQRVEQILAHLRQEGCSGRYRKHRLHRMLALFCRIPRRSSPQ